MNNDDERDYAEEAANRRLLETGDDPPALEVGDARRWVVVAGEDAYVFARQWNASQQYTVCIGASLDAELYATTARKWACAVATVRGQGRHLTVHDFTGSTADDPPDADQAYLDAGLPTTDDDGEPPF